MDDGSTLSNEVSRDQNVAANSSAVVNRSDVNCSDVSASSGGQNDSAATEAATDATRMSTDSAMSSSAYDAIQQYSEAELHGEYEAQYFGFTADSVADGLYNAVIQHMWEAVSSVKDIMQKKVTDEQSELIGSKLMAKFQDTVNRAFDKLAIYLKTNIFKIPGNVVLPEDKVQIDYKYSASEEDTVDKEIEELEAAINNSKYVNACLRQEIKDNSNILEEMDQVLTYLSSVEETFLQAGVANMKETFKTMKNQMNELKEIVETIQPIEEPPEKKSRLLET